MGIPNAGWSCADSQPVLSLEQLDQLLVEATQLVTAATATVRIIEALIRLKNKPAV